MLSLLSAISVVLSHTASGLHLLHIQAPTLFSSTPLQKTLLLLILILISGFDLLYTYTSLTTYSKVLCSAEILQTLHHKYPTTIYTPDSDDWALVDNHRSTYKLIYMITGLTYM